MAIIKSTSKRPEKPIADDSEDTSTAPKVTGKYIDKIIKDGVEYEIHAANGGETTKAKEFLCWSPVVSQDNLNYYTLHYWKENSASTLPVLAVGQWYRGSFTNRRKPQSHGVWKGVNTFGTYSRNSKINTFEVYHKDVEEQSLTPDEEDICLRLLKNICAEWYENNYFDVNGWSHEDQNHLANWFSHNREKPYTKQFKEQWMRKYNIGDWDEFDGTPLNNFNFYIAKVDNVPTFESTDLAIGITSTKKYKKFNKMSIKFLKNYTINEDALQRHLPPWSGTWSSTSLLIVFKLIYHEYDKQWYLVAIISPEKINTVAEKELVRKMKN